MGGIQPRHGEILKDLPEGPALEKGTADAKSKGASARETNTGKKEDEEVAASSGDDGEVAASSGNDGEARTPAAEGEFSGEHRPGEPANATNTQGALAMSASFRAAQEQARQARENALIQEANAYANAEIAALKRELANLKKAKEVEALKL